jgi:hypothetical protein
MCSSAAAGNPAVVLIPAAAVSCWFLLHAVCWHAGAGCHGSSQHRFQLFPVCISSAAGRSYKVRLKRKKTKTKKLCGKYRSAAELQRRKYPLVVIQQFQLLAIKREGTACL